MQIVCLFENCTDAYKHKHIHIQQKYIATKVGRKEGDHGKVHEEEKINKWKEIRTPKEAWAV